MYWNSTNSSSSISTSTTSQSAPNPSEYTFGVARNYPLSSSSSSTVDSTAGVYRSLPKHQRRPNKRQERVRKRRILFSQAQIHGLEQSFKSNQYLTSPKREILARTLNLTKKQVTIWFQNNRLNSTFNISLINVYTTSNYLYFSILRYKLKKSR